MAKRHKKAKAAAIPKAESPLTAPAAKGPGRAVTASRPAAAQPAAAQAAGPLAMIRRLAEEMDQLVGDFRTSFFPRFDLPKAEATWAPPIEVSERGAQLVIRAELPGLSKKDVRVEVREDALSIAGERRREREEKRKGFYRSERSYGSFFRRIPLPEGIKPEDAKATFKDGVLEVTMPAPPKPAKGRAVPIDES